MSLEALQSGGFTIPYVNGRDCLGIGIALPLVCLLVTGLRFYTRHSQNARYGADDYFILGGLIAVIGMGICFIYGSVHKAMGYPSGPIPTNLTDDEILLYIDPGYELLEKIFMMIAYGFIKLSIVAFYRRLFVVNKRTKFDIITMLTQVVLILWAFTFILLVIFPCGKHIWANWGSTEAQLKYCTVVFTSEYGLIISDLILDIYVFVLPLPMVWKLHLSTTRKLLVSGILLLGASAIGASITRVVVYYRAISALTALEPVDPNLAVTLGLYWSFLEAGLALIAGCLPTLSHLFTRRSLQSAIASVRSALSLSSLQSSRATKTSQGVVPGQGSDAPYFDVEMSGSKSSQSNVGNKIIIEAAKHDLHSS